MIPEPYLSALRFVMLETLVKSLFLFVIVGLLRLALRHASASARHLLWLCTLAAMLLLPWLSFTLPAWWLPLAHLIEPAPVAAQSGSTHPSSDAISESVSGSLPPEVPDVAPNASFIPGKVTLSNASPTWMTSEPRSTPACKTTSPFAFALLSSLPLFWLAGVGIVLARRVVALLRIRKFARAHSCMMPTPLAERTLELARREGYQGRLRLRTETAGTPPASPMTWGWLPPTLLLPSDAGHWPESRLRAVLLHELAHIRRADWLTQQTAQVVCALYWFDPLVWLAAKQLRVEGERACDDLALSAGIPASDYARHLLEIVRKMKTTPSFASAAVSMARLSQLESRVRAILDTKRKRTRLTHRMLSCAVLTTMGLLVPLAAVHVSAKPSVPAEIRTLPTIHIATTEPEVAPLHSAIELAPADMNAHLAGMTPGSPGVGIRLHPVLLPAPPKPSALPQELAPVDWGEARDGLEAGIRLTPTRRQFIVGERVSLETYLRNRTDQPIAFAYSINDFDDQPEIEDADGNVRQIQHSIRAGLPSAIALVLPPGMTLMVPHTGVVIGPNAIDKRNPMPFFEQPIPGTYRLRQNYRYRLLSLEDVKALEARREKERDHVYSSKETLLTREGKKLSRVAVLTGAGAFGMNQREKGEAGLWTGTVRFEVVDKADTNDPAKAVPPAPKTETTAWGPTMNGLQAGVRFPGGRNRYVIGETVVTEVFVRNVREKPITFTSRSSPQFFQTSPLSPTVIGPDGKESPTDSSRAIQFQSRTVTLKPGEQTQVSRSVVILEGSGGFSRGTGIEPAAIVEPGKCRIRQDVHLKPEGGQDETLHLTSGALDFEAVSSVGKAAWGRAVGGLQCGLSFASSRSRFAVGETAYLDLYWRNASDHDLQVSYAEFNSFEYYSDVFNEKGEPMKLYGTFPWFFPAKAICVLKPGETILIGHPAFAIATHRDETAGDTRMLDAPPGKYHIRQSSIVQPYDGGPDKTVATVSSSTTPLSGDLEFEIVK